MTNKKSTKRALLFSLLTLVICVSMLVGSTYAWFTDTVTSTNNKIQSGTLKVDLELHDKANGWQSVKDSQAPIFNYDKWEPGFVDVKLLKIENEGSLALKWVAKFVSSAELSALADVIDVYVLPTAAEATYPVDRNLDGYTYAGTVASFVNTIEETTSGTLMAGEKQYLAIALKMRESAGNDYQTLDLGSFDIQILATQLNSEVDSFDKDYDINADYVVSVSTQEELLKAINNVSDGEVIVLKDNITFTTDANGNNGISYTGAASFTLDLNGKTVTSNLGGNALRFKIGSGNDIKNTDVTINVVNGKVVSGSDNWCAISAATESGSGNTITLNLVNVDVENSKAGDFGVKSWEGATIIATDVDVTATGAAGGFYAVGGEVVLNNCTVDQKGLHTAPYLSTAFAVSTNGKMTVNSGTYKTEPTSASEGYNQGTSHGSWVGNVMNSGGTLVINGGTFTNGNYGDDALATNARGVICVDTYGKCEINGGTFNALKNPIEINNNLGIAAGNPVITLKGGVYNTNPLGGNVSNCIKVANGFTAKENANGTWTVKAPENVATLEALTAALANGDNVKLTADIDATVGITIPAGVTFDGNGHEITYAGTEYAFHLIKPENGAVIKNVTFNNYKIKPTAANTTGFTLTDVTINMDNDATGIELSSGSGVIKMTNVTCASITDAAHLDPATQVQVEYTPYGDVVLGGTWGLDAKDCTFGTIQGWNTRNGSNVSLTNTTYAAFRMHYMSGRTLTVDGVVTAWADSDAIPVAHDVGGCWSVMASFR